MCVPGKNPCYLALIVWSGGTDHGRDKNAGLLLGNLQTKDRKASLSPSSPHRNMSFRLSLHLFKGLQIVPHTHRKAESHLPYSTQTWIRAHCVHLTESHSSAHHCITAFTLAHCFAIPAPLKRIL